MVGCWTLRAALLGAASLLAAQTASQPAQAQSDSRIDGIQAQIRALNAELARVKRDMAAKDAAVRAAQSDAAHARQTAEQTQATVANLPLPPGFVPGNGRSTGPGFGMYQAHPEYPSPRTDFSSLNASPATEGGQEAGGTGHKGEFHIGGVTIQLGGFIEGAGIFRTRNEVTDIASNFNTASRCRKARSTTRASSRDARGRAASPSWCTATWTPTSTSPPTPRWTCRAPPAPPTATRATATTRASGRAYASYDNDALGVHVLAGQAWSLATMTKVGVTPRQEDVPLTIDAAIRARLQLGAAAAVPRREGFRRQNTGWRPRSRARRRPTRPAPTAPAWISAPSNSNNTGISTLTPGQAYSTDIAPDVIVKAAADPGWGHYEVFGIARFFHDRVSGVGNGHNNTRLAGGVGGGAILPVIDKQLDVRGARPGRLRHRPLRHVPAAGRHDRPQRRAGAAGRGAGAGRAGRPPRAERRPLQLRRHRAGRPQVLHRRRQGLRLRQPAVRPTPAATSN